jgi:UDPglucose--hexose-1-phosphate uridylyltransferase
VPAEEDVRAPTGASTKQHRTLSGQRSSPDDEDVGSGATVSSSPSDVRVDPLTGAVVVVAGGRQGRPDLSAGADPAGCPFCPGGLEAPAPYRTRWFPNRWPSLPDGRAELLLYTPDHDAPFWSLGVDGAVAVVELWQERTAAQGARPDVSYVLVFENRGPAVGATVPHSHGQLYAFSFVPEAPARELRASSCALCAEPDGSRRVVTAGGWRAEVPYAPAWPFELRLAPRGHVPDLPSLDAAGVRDLAAVLVDGLARLDQLFDARLPYMLWWHQRPTDGGDWPLAHLHAHVAPLWRSPGTPRFVAAGELGSGVFFDPVVPEEAAARLRELPGAS